MPVIPVMLPPGRARLATRPVLTGSPTASHDDGNRLRRGLGSLGRWRGYHDDEVHRQADQLRCQGREAIHLAGGPAVLDGDGLALNPAEIAQPLLESLI